MSPSRRHPDIAQPVDITVVFATCNRAAQLRATLDAYRRIDTAGIHWELLVVDNDSQDESQAILAATSDLPLRWQVVTAPGQNNARNAALKRIRGALIVFTDDDAIPEPDCLQAYLRAARRWPNEAIFGARIDPRFPAGTPQWMQQANFRFASTAFARYAPRNDEGPVSRHPYGPSFAVRRSALGAHQFPTHLGPRSGSYAMGGEGHLLRRLRHEGWRYIHVPSARVEHVIRPDQIAPAWLFARANKKGRGQVYLPSDKPANRYHWRGVPLRLWMSTIRCGLRFYLLGPFVNDRLRTRYGIKYELRRGEIQERLLSRTHIEQTDYRPAPGRNRGNYSN
ncbi:glycosyltransferase family 2 protein [Salinisphaera sp. T31B1]|uniref:glycosyltransferase family 2 protein n=1 Tax=Salinisphaera sp. T31B1 TaxID=727963 RepID=UPI003340097F